MSVAVLAAVTAAVSVAPATAVPEPRTERITVSAAGEQLAASSGGPSLSADGRYAAFATADAGVVPGDTNGESDVFVRDLRRGTVERVNVATDGTQADAGSHSARISDDGRYVAFISGARTLAEWSEPSATRPSDVYVHDRRTGRTERVSAAPDGGTALVRDGFDLSGDGRYVAFSAARMESGGSGHTRAYVTDRRTGETRLISDRVPADWYVPNVRLSADGTHLAYTQRHPRGGPGELWLADLRTGEQKQLNVTPEGEKTDGVPAGVSLSANGRYAVFSSFDDALVPGTPAYTWELYLRDTRTGTTRRITHEGTGGLSGGQLSADGRTLAYQRETALPDGGTADNVYVRDLATGRTTLATPGVTGEPLTEGYTAPTGFARGGRLLGLASSSAQLVPGDTNGESDGFVRRVR
ncbi:TolB family protein [Streptomyces sp. enrichment culture]|uniref:TolB family protein n=1 Tax=Streptomyces sp. enrichment culture TaxID=1795815 RepID=UPI003F5464E0